LISTLIEKKSQGLLTLLPVSTQKSMV